MSSYNQQTVTILFLYNFYLNETCGKCDKRTRELLSADLLKTVNVLTEEIKSLRLIINLLQNDLILLNNNYVENQNLMEKTSLF